ncbi:Zinc finger HIT domain-containing protein 2 [Nymphon striatum]|nr:Zinc finger HIT domain-containing protein 2 [Nymphon striatum]
MMRKTMMYKRGRETHRKKMIWTDHPGVYKENISVLEKRQQMQKTEKCKKMHRDQSVDSSEENLEGKHGPHYCSFKVFFDNNLLCLIVLINNKARRFHTFIANSFSKLEIKPNQCRTSVDHFGPFKQGSKQLKLYGGPFTCMDSRSVRCPFGKMSIRQNAQSAKSPVGKLSSSAKSPFDKLSVDQTSFGKVSFGKMSVGKMSVGKRSAHQSFYQDCVTEYLRGDFAGKDAKTQMVETLKKQKDEYENFDDTGLTDCFSELEIDSLDSKQLWNILSDDEKSRFKSIVKSGEIAEIIPDFDPWWKVKISHKLVQPVELENEDESVILRAPKINEDIKMLSEFTKVSPSPVIPYNILNVLYSYAYIVWYFNGEHHENLEACMAIIELSNNLKEKEIFTCVSDSVNRAISKVLENRSYFISNEFSAQVISDLESIIEGPDPQRSTYYVQAALCDCLKLMNDSKKELQPSDKSIVKLACKKIEYYISWTAEYGQSLHSFLPTLELEYQSIIENIKTHNEINKEVNAQQVKSCSQNL